MTIEGDMPTPDGHCRGGYRAAAAAPSNQDVTGWVDGDSMRASEPLTALRGGQMRLEEPGTAVLGRPLLPGDSYATVSAAG